jgi:hypothetical protein
MEANRPPENPGQCPPNDAHEDATALDSQSDSGDKDAGQSTHVNAMSTSGKGPARGYSWPPFEPGNTAAVKTGGRSPRIRAAKADELEPGFCDWLAGNAPWATAAALELQRVNYLWSKAAVELYAPTVVKVLAGEATMSTRDIETFLSALRNEREALRDLGLTVLTKAQLAQTVASTEATLADLAAQGRQTSGYQANAIDAEPEPDEAGGES